MLSTPGMVTKLKIVMLVMSILGTVAALPIKSQKVAKHFSSGIKGVIVATGNCPGPQRKDDTSCGPRPYQGPLAVKLKSDDKIVATISSDSKGKFSIGLPPGTYFITQSGESRYPLIHSDDIVVTKHKFTAVNLTADLGMR
jgi:hypothetical protein